MNPIIEDVLMHYGMPRRSGRYPWGSGGDPYQHSGDFISRVQELKRSGMNEQEIAESVGCKNTSELRIKYSLARNERRYYEVARAKSLAAEGLTPTQIGKEMGRSESSVRSLLDDQSEARMNQAVRIADFLRDQADSKKMVLVGTGVERELVVSRDKLNQALAILEEEGYGVYGGGVPQVTNSGKQTNIRVLCSPDIKPAEGKKSPKEIYDFENVHSVEDYKVRQDENGDDIVVRGFVYPKSMDSDRLQIRYAEEGGLQKDGVIELRRNVPDLSLGESHYAQIRILVDDKKYLKGMAIYSDDMPEGVDVVFNTNKKLGTPKEDVLKNIGKDPDNPFGSLIKENGGQYTYIDDNGKEQLGLINKRAIEGDWEDWSNAVPSQFLSKQSKLLIERQLGREIDDRQMEFDDICALENPTIKKELLQSFAEDCDSAAVHLKAAALPRQKYQVILPITTMKDTEVYAPNYNDGETVALIRYPHGGTFEIPILVVNNKQPDGRRILGNTPTDAIGINSKVAERLSGADFDGDTVMVVPCNSPSSKVHIISTPRLKGLENFDAKLEYGADRVEKQVKNGKEIEVCYRNGVQFNKMNNTQTEMGKISNLITDMTLGGAGEDELARAVRHSMVVIDAEKHHLDYRQSEVDNGIASLKKKWQGHTDEDGRERGGASTLISRAKSEVSVLKRRGAPKVNEKGREWYDPDKPEGSLIFKSVYEEYTDKKGKTKVRTQKSTQMAETDDARTLSAGSVQETLYANFANKMKEMANTARMTMLHAGKIVYSSSAAIAYQKEVASLKHQLNLALKNAPREQMAQLYANSVVKAKKRANPDIKQSELKKIAQQALSAGRLKYGAKRMSINIGDREWAAIQAGAISETTLKDIIRNADKDQLRQRATPKSYNTLSSAKVARIHSLRNSGYTTAEIAKAVGCSASAVTSYINGKE
ncbi:MAG TPA: helix-turn-helix domain-containing protein [Candidatus Limiplasma sp.]|nr:helix-turn-helix domain-containing protein [Candidatus Limiplasma sp.]